MNSQSIVWICPGNMAPNCAGKVGDVLVASAVTRQLQAEGWDIHFVCNEIMAPHLAQTYAISVSVIADTLNSGDLEKAAAAQHVFILRPFGDLDGNRWQQQLVQEGIDPRRILRVGMLNAFSVEGPHMVQQIVTSIGSRVPLSSEGMLFPLLKLDEEKPVERKGHATIDHLILPFAGGRPKWLPKETVLGIVDHIGGNVGIAGTPFGEEPNGLAELKSVFRGREPSPEFITASMTEIAAIGSSCRNIFCVDGGICWATVSGLNWLALNDQLSEDEYPNITVILGRDEWWNLAPTAPVWKPLAVYPQKVRQVNATQTVRLVDVPVSEDERSRDVQPNPAIEPTGLSVSGRRERPCAGGSSPSRYLLNEGTKGGKDGFV